MRVLITGGAGFIGSHLADSMIEAGYDVRVLDNLDPQVHGPSAGRPSYLHTNVDLRIGDVRDPDVVRDALDGVQMLVHFAAAVGVGQSMYEIRRYADVNMMGAATLLEAVVATKPRLQRMLVASSMSIYGEGRYLCAKHGGVTPPIRAVQQLQDRDWEPRCPTCGSVLEPQATDETKAIQPSSVYAITKRDHEEMFLTVGRAYGVATTALRFFNVYGTRQALSNPYTGVAAIFCGAMLNGTSPVIFEDGRQRRDFVHVSDIVSACLLGLTKDRAIDEVFNIGSGEDISILELYSVLANALAFGAGPQLTGRARVGDIRHCWADIGKARELLGYRPRVFFNDGVSELISWVKTQRAKDATTAAMAELERRGLQV
jgi:dTDP-L-rhamnose 4-epimerase